MYRHDKIGNIRTKIRKLRIKKKLGWCDDPTSSFYNKLINFPFKKSAEKLFLKKNIYDIILVINYNLNPVKKNKGSAIFLHIATKNYSPTGGCLAINKRDLLKILPQINKKTKLIIH